jgi:hypothetical protein
MSSYRGKRKAPDTKREESSSKRQFRQDVADPNSRYPSVNLTAAEMIVACEKKDVKGTGIIKDGLKAKMMKLYLDDGNNRYSRRLLTEFQFFSEYGIGDNTKWIEKNMPTASEEEKQKSFSESIVSGTQGTDNGIVGRLNDALYNRGLGIIEEHKDAFTRFAAKKPIKLASCAKSPELSEAPDVALPPQWNFTLRDDMEYGVITLPSTPGADPVYDPCLFEDMPRKTAGHYVIVVNHFAFRIKKEQDTVNVAFSNYPQSLYYIKPVVQPNASRSRLFPTLVKAVECKSQETPKQDEATRKETSTSSSTDFVSPHVTLSTVKKIGDVITNVEPSKPAQPQGSPAPQIPQTEEVQTPVGEEYSDHSDFDDQGDVSHA